MATDAIRALGIPAASRCRGERRLLHRCVVERELLSPGSLDKRRPALDVVDGERSACVGAFPAACGEASAELAGRCVEEAQLDSGAQGACALAQRVALAPAPTAPLDDHDRPEF